MPFVDKAPATGSLLNPASGSSTPGQEFTILESQSGTAFGLTYDPGVVGGFSTKVYVKVNATAQLGELFELNGAYTGTDWKMTTTSCGDDTGITFTISSLGILSYSSGTWAGFTSATAYVTEDYVTI